VYGDRIQNSTRVQIFLASLDHLKKIMYRREEKIDEITEYARSLEDAVHRKDAEIGDIAAQVNDVTTYARSLEDAVHRKDAEIGVVTHYARSLEDTVHKKDIVISELNSCFLQATEYSQSLDDQITAMKRSFITWLRMRKQR
jgi:chromosome segregation ATPase